jgi:D-3-phosphoglycerate dehydrogenase
VGIVGLGRIGKRVASLYKSLGCKVIAFDLYPDLNWSTENDVRLVSLNELLQHSDIITIHVPGSDSKALIASVELALTKPNMILINLARGGVIDEQALFNHLKAVPTSSAAVDVFIQEPYSGELTQLENVVLTPHLGSYAKEAKLGMELDAVRNLIEALK